MKAPTHSIHRVTLEIRVPRSLPEPQMWDWPGLLDMPDRDDVKVVSHELAPFED